jgi:hypothetical protein
MAHIHLSYARSRKCEQTTDNGAEEPTQLRQNTRSLSFTLLLHTTPIPPKILQDQPTTAAFQLLGSLLYTNKPTSATSSLEERLTRFALSEVEPPRSIAKPSSVKIMVD